MSRVGPGRSGADIDLLQQTAGSFVPEPPVPWAWALGDPTSLLAQYAQAGLRADVATEAVEFAFDDFASAWDVLAGVITWQLETERAEADKTAVRKACRLMAMARAASANASSFSQRTVSRRSEAKPR
jgi:hypothetical protein